MPTPEQFAKRIRARGRRVEENTNILVIRTALAISQTVIAATPVDTGRARANWQAAIGVPITQEIDNEDQSGQGTISRNKGIIQSRKVKQTIYLSNNLAYIGALNAGSSSQAPANFVESAVQVGVNFVRRAKVVK